jgi:uncharacterized protein YjdB
MHYSNVLHNSINLFKMAIKPIDIFHNFKSIGFPFASPMFCIFLCVLGFTFNSRAQVTSVNYQIKYNQDSCWYDAFLIINAGSATTVDERKQDFSIYSLVVPAGTYIDVIRNYNPIKNNATYSGNTPNNWIIYAAIGAPTIDPSSDYYIFAPSLDDEAHFNDINTGDTIKLFSFFIDTILNCGQGIRVFENGIDPGPTAPGMGFIDFNNIFDFTTGSDVYNANSPKITPPVPLIYDTIVSCDLGIELNISSSTTLCQQPLNYQWYGPNNYYATTEDIAIYPANQINTGNYKVVVSDVYGCKDSIEIYAHNKPQAGSDMVTCANTAIQLVGSDPANGTWFSFNANNPGYTLVNQSSGLANVSFDQTAVGLYKFVYTTSTCTDTMDVTVFPLPVINYIGPDSLCNGGITQLIPDSGGFWVSNNPTVAAINSSGLVTSLAEGIATFTFTEIASGCPSTSDTLVVNPIPEIVVTGTPSVCVGSNTTLLPGTGGIWTSSSPLIASVDSSGLVTGLSVGQTQLVYQDTLTGCASFPESMEVKAVPTIEIFGTNTICPNATAQLLPSSGGIWETLNPLIASINSSGLVTGMSPGIANFIFTDGETGCMSSISDNITVVSSPVITMSANNICSGNFTYLTADAAGTWTSSNIDIATVVLNAGLVTGISPGNAVFTFIRSADFCATISDTLTVNPSPTISAGTTELCVGSTTTLNADSTGTWTSLDENIVMISGNTAVGISSGFVTVIFTETSSGCENSLLLHVSERAQTNIIETDNICVGLTTQLSPSTGGVWTSSNNSIASVNNSGQVTGISAGTATFIFTETATGCNSLPTNSVTIKGLPTVSISGPDSICIGTNTLMTASGSGLWMSNHLNIASIDPIAGDVTGHESGSATFSFTESISGCTSLPSSPVVVKARPILTISGSTIICSGAVSQISPSSGGIWQSNNPSVAMVDNTGFISSIGAGMATFTYTQTGTGCIYVETSEILTVVNCFIPDINVVPTNILATGNLSTNDDDPQLNYYNNSFELISGPAGGTPLLTVSPDGSYTFEADLEGIYTLEINVCILPNVVNCPTSTLVVTVKNDFLPNKTITANTDLVYTSFNSPVTINTLKNDACIIVGSCSPDPSSVSIIRAPISGSTNISPISGDISYTPINGFSGRVQLIYKVCVMGDPLNCDTASQIITVLEQMADNTLFANDDVITGNKRATLNGNVLTNDVDPEGNILSVLAQNITTASGTFQLNTNGSFTFVPTTTFTGAINFPYEVCDNNANPICKKGTLYILVLSELSVNIRVYLEGALMNNANATAGGRPLMRDNLRVSPFNSINYIPSADPYKFPSTFVNLSSKYTHKSPGNKLEFAIIADPTTVFSVSGRDAIVDWVFIELRSKTNKSDVKATRSALLQRDGDVVDIDGISSVRFPETVIDSYYVAIRHRNHLGAMTAIPQSPDQLNDVVNFTSPTTPMFDFGTSQNNGYNYAGMAQKTTVKSGYLALWAGDFDANRKIKTQSPNDDINLLLVGVLFYPVNSGGNSNFNSAFGYLQGDYDMNSKSKFDNPNDDKNMLYAQLLFYPLNASLLQNFNFFIEQLP